MKLTHKQKVKLAHKLRTPQELRDKVSIWLSKGWSARQEAIKNRVEKQ